MTRKKTNSHCGWRLLLALIALLAITGCQQAPSFNIIGSIFPDWIFCSIIGLVAGPVAHAIFVRLDLDKEIQPPILIYPCIVLSCTLTLWLILFS